MKQHGEREVHANPISYDLVDDLQACAINVGDAATHPLILL